MSSRSFALTLALLGVLYIAQALYFARVLVHDRFTETVADLIGPNVQLHHVKMHLKPPEVGAPFLGLSVAAGSRYSARFILAASA